MNEFMNEWTKEIYEPKEVMKSAFDLARELYNNNQANNQEVETIYNDIVEINNALTYELPIDYAALNVKITDKYSSIPAIGNITFYKVSLDFLHEQTVERNKETLALIAKSLSILMSQIKMRQVGEIFVSSVFGHVGKAGIRAGLNVGCRM